MCVNPYKNTHCQHKSIWWNPSRYFDRFGESALLPAWELNLQHKSIVFEQRWSLSLSHSSQVLLLSKLLEAYLCRSTCIHCDLIKKGTCQSVATARVFRSPSKLKSVEEVRLNAGTSEASRRLAVEHITQTTKHTNCELERCSNTWTSRGHDFHSLQRNAFPPAREHWFSQAMHLDPNNY